MTTKTGSKEIKQLARMDWRAYYGLPPAESWNDNLGVAPIGVLFWLLILFWPALIALIHRINFRRTVNP